MSEGKICTKCNEFKYFNEYDKNNTRPIGVKSSCKQCNKTKKLLHYQKNKEKYKQCYQEFMKRNPDYQTNYYNNNKNN